MIKRISAFIYGSVYYGIAHLTITTRRSNQLHSAPERGRRHAMKSAHLIGFAAAALLACAAPSLATESKDSQTRWSCRTGKWHAKREPRPS